MNARIVALVLLTSSGCASMVNKVDQDSVSRMKSVAIIGLTYDQQAANSGSTMLDNVMGKNDPGMMGKSIGEITAPPHVAHAYEILRTKLESRKGWQVIPRAKTVAMPGVASLYAKKDATVQIGVMPLRPMFYRAEVSGIPQFYYVQSAAPAALNIVAKELGVDGLVILNAATRLSQTSVLGLGVGSIGSVTDIAVFLYDPKRSEFTVVMNVSGDEAKTTDSKVGGFADKDTMNIQALISYGSALDKAIEKI